MSAAAADLEFETAARLRDEIKRLQATELAIADDPFARQSEVDRAVDDAFLGAVQGWHSDSASPSRGRSNRQSRFGWGEGPQTPPTRRPPQRPQNLRQQSK